MCCENLSENEAKFLILEQTRFLRVLTRKYWFSVNMPSTKGHNYWTQLPTTMKFCQNVPHMYILKAKKFQVWKNISKPRLGNFGQKIGGNGENLKFYLRGGSKNENFWNLTFWTHFYYQNECYVKIWVKTKQISRFYSVFPF